MRYLRASLTAAAVLVALAAAGGGTYAFLTGGSAEAAAPDPTPSDSTGTPTKDHDCGKVGEYQEEVEKSLESLAEYGSVFVDGEQSQEDCDAIEAFQKRFGIKPAKGQADELTRDVAKRIAEQSFDECPTTEHGTTICVDLTNQTLWVVEDGERIFGPTVVRTGMAGHASTTGTHTINHRADREWSEPYEQWLPYWQHYYAGEGLHETTSYLHDPSLGSHGCTNLLRQDAKKLYEMLDYGDTVQVFGKRSGT